jgi:hypothetical protein
LLDWRLLRPGDRTRRNGENTNNECAGNGFQARHGQISSHLMDFLRNFKTALDAKTDFRTTDSIADLRDFCRADLCTSNVILTAEAKGSRNTPV